MFDRFERSWDLANACMGLLREDKSLLVFPLLSSMAMLLIVGSFAVPLYPLVSAMSEHGYVRTLDSLTYVGLFMFYWIQFTIVTFFNTALGGGRQDRSTVARRPQAMACAGRGPGFRSSLRTPPLPPL